jgi:hypothetical protein
MKFNILNGDAIAAEFPVQGISGEVIVIREAFMDGPVSTIYDEAYWNERKKYIQLTYEENSSVYDQRVKSEFEKLQRITSRDEVYLWFEDDLFCQCNMWAAISYIQKHNQPKYYRVFPEEDEQNWKGFSRAGANELKAYYHAALELSATDIIHIRELWEVFVHEDKEALKRLSKIPCRAIRFQEEVINAQLERMQEPELSRPYRTLAALKQENDLPFYQLFEKFSRQEGIYGFGDTQVINMLKEI